MSEQRNLNYRTITLSVFLTFVTASAALSQPIPFAGQMKVNDGPTINFTDTTVSCSGLSPGDSVTLVGFAIDRRPGSQSITTPTITQEADNNGIFTATIDGGVKARSIWLLINRTTGGRTIAAPQGSVLRQMPDGTVSAFEGRPLYGHAMPPGTAAIYRAHTHVIRIASGQLMDSRSHRLRNLSTAGDSLPSGLTVFDAKDGSGIDDDGTTDGIVNMTFPDSLQVGDFLFVVDDRTLEFQLLVLDACNLLQECLQ